MFFPGSLGKEIFNESRTAIRTYQTRIKPEMRDGPGDESNGFVHPQVHLSNAPGSFIR